MTEAALKVAPEEAFKILESSEEDAKDFARRIKQIV